MTTRKGERPPPSWVAYLLAGVATAVAVGIRWLLDPALGEQLTLVMLFSAVAVSVWYGGYLPAMMAAVVGYLSCDYLFIEPRFEVGIGDLDTAVGLLAFLISSSIIIVLGEAMRRAQRRTREGRELLWVTLSSIGDAVMTTDVDGRVTYLNATAESLTGWSRAEAAGQPVETVFHILDEESRERAASPVARALREGYVVGLANHTLLVAKDGKERPIDDSVAPIRDERGRVVGAVLVFRDVTERRRADRRKDEFLATLAHELRNPLAPVRTALEILIVKSPPDPQLKWALGVIDRQVAHLTRLLEDLLDISRISHDKLELRKQRIELRTVIQSAIETSRPLVDDGEHELTVDLPSEPLYLEADPVRLAQVFSNLLNNAAKYTDEGGHIRLSCRASDGCVEVSVEDDGIGIAADVLPRVFDMFSQEKGAIERSDGGLGIGLALVRGLVELHGGSIEAHSEGSGKGSRLTVRLPLAAGPALAHPQSQTTEAAHKPATRHRFLIVDDRRDSADSLATLLEMMGHEARTAYDGEEAIAAAASLKPEVLLLDIGMPKRNGYEVCRHVRQQPWGKDMTIIALTGWGQENDRRSSEEAGFDHHLVKPAAPEALLELLEPEPRNAEAD